MVPTSPCLSYPRQTATIAAAPLTSMPTAPMSSRALTVDATVLARPTSTETSKIQETAAQAATTPLKPAPLQVSRTTTTSVRVLSHFLDRAISDILLTEEACPDAYAYAYDESSDSALFTCADSLNSDYTLTFCP